MKQRKKSEWALLAEQEKKGRKAIECERGGEIGRKTTIYTRLNGVQLPMPMPMLLQVNRSITIRSQFRRAQANISKTLFIRNTVHFEHILKTYKKWIDISICMNMLSILNKHNSCKYIFNYTYILQLIYISTSFFFIHFHSENCCQRWGMGSINCNSK